MRNEPTSNGVKYECPHFEANVSNRIDPDRRTYTFKAELISER